MFFRSREGSSFAVGQELESQGELSAARRFYEEVIRSGHPEYAPRATHRMGHVLQQQGNTEGALSAFQRAIDSGNRKVAHLAEGAQTLLLGTVLQRLLLDPPAPANTTGVQAAYTWAVSSGRRDIAGRMAYSLGKFFQEHGDDRRAIEAYQQAIDSGDPKYARKAADARASLTPPLTGSAATSATAGQEAADAGHHERSARETMSLGLQCERDGDIAEAVAAYRQVIDSHDPEYAAEAAYNLGLLLEKQRDVAGALAAYKQAEDAGYGLAHGCVYSLLQDPKNVSAARAAYQWAVESGHHEAPVAAYALGRFLEETDVTEALTLYQQVIDSGNPESTQAEDALDSLLMRFGQGTAKAFAIYQWMLDFGDPEKIEMAADNLEEALFSNQHNVKEARKVHRWATDSGQIEHLPGVAHQLGRVFEEAADVATARALYQQTIDSGDADEAPLAAYSLGKLLEAQGDAAGARVAYQQALDSPNAQSAKTAAETLESFLLDQRDATAARAVYQWATDSGHGDASRRAAYALGQILEGRGDAEGALAAYQSAVKAGYRRATKAAEALRKHRAHSRAGDSAGPVPADSPEVSSSPDGLSNRERVGRGLEILASGLGQFTSTRLPPSSPDASDWVDVFVARDKDRGRAPREYSLSDARFQLRIITEEQRALRGGMPSSARAYAAELRDTGNNWAHGGAFSDDDADRALDTMARLLAVVGATGQADQIRGLRR